MPIFMPPSLGRARKSNELKIVIFKIDKNEGINIVFTFILPSRPKYFFV